MITHSVLDAVKRWLWPQRLHHQLVLMVSMALVLALGLLGGYTASEQADIALQGHEGQAKSMARNVAIASGNLILTDSLDQLEELVLRSADFDEITSLRVINADGRVLSHVTRGKSQAPRLVFDLPAQVTTLPTRAEPSESVRSVSAPRARALSASACADAAAARPDPGELRRQRIVTPLARDERLLLTIEELQRIKRRRYAD